MTVDVLLTGKGSGALVELFALRVFGGVDGTKGLTVVLKGGTGWRREGCWGNTGQSKRS